MTGNSKTSRNRPKPTTPMAPMTEITRKSGESVTIFASMKSRVRS